MPATTNTANVTWAKGSRAAQAGVKKLADTAANRAALQAEAAKDQLPSAVVKMGKDVALISSAALQTGSRIARTEGASIQQGDTLSIGGTDATVLYEDDGFAEIDTKDVIVAIIDTGLDVNHPAIKGRVVSPYNVIDHNTDVTDEEGHGTHVAGIIAGARGLNADSEGGVAPNVKIMPIKAAGKNGGFRASNVAEGIRYAADHGAKVINMSLGGPLWMPYVQDAIKYAESKGVVVVCAMGNSGKQSAAYPARFDGVLAVASSKDGKRSKFSNYGDRTDVTAPGEHIISSVPGGKYGDKSGTSMASPYVAGAVALVMAQHPDWTPAQVRDWMDRAVNDVGPTGWDKDTGYGEVNLFKAVYGKDLAPVVRAPQPPKQSFWQKVMAFFHLA
ncbi:MAG: peptidase [Cyanobacteria bacterium RYN_339]|nr:peptidase [Cyanobacteria bacterium RYN_339]